MHSIYVARDHKGKVVAVSPDQQEGYCASDINDPEVSAFLAASDLDLVRVLEDLIDLLTTKGIIRFTDLPPEAQSKLSARKSTRSALRAIEAPISDAIEGI